MTQKEVSRAHIIEQACNGAISEDTASKNLGLSIRQIRRLKRKFGKDGVKSVPYGLRGKPGNYHPDPGRYDGVKSILQSPMFAGFGPVFASEKLTELNDIHLSPFIVRSIMVNAGIWKVRKQKKEKAPHQWRERKACFGEMEQFDGSYHQWFEDRDGGLYHCLLLATDDATGDITKTCFGANEGIDAVYAFWKEYVEEQGKPRSTYLDKFSTYKSNYPNATDTSEIRTQFGKVMQSLGIKLIFANSPQAKGRVERMNGTLQDRLVKELRLANISTIDAANKFLKEVFIPKFNARFGRVPREEGNLHQPLSEEEKGKLVAIFSTKDTRKIQNDYTIAYKKQYYQLCSGGPLFFRGDTVQVETWFDKTLHISFKGRYIQFKILPERLGRRGENNLPLAPMYIPLHQMRQVLPREKKKSSWMNSFHLKGSHPKLSNQSKKEKEEVLPIPLLTRSTPT